MLMRNRFKDALLHVVRFNLLDLPHFEANGEL